MKIVSLIGALFVIILLALGGCAPTPTSEPPASISSPSPTNNIQPSPISTSAATPIPSTQSSPTIPPTLTPFPEPPRITRLVGEDDKKLIEIVLSDSRIQELIKDRSYDFIVNNHQIQGQDWHLATGVVLKEGLTTEQRQKFTQQSLAGQTDHTVIDKYLGILTLGDIAVIFMPGYNDIYDIIIDWNNAKVKSITLEPRSDIQMPQLTLSERKQAITLALSDAKLQEILKDKSYRVAPTGVHVSIDNLFNKDGATFEIWLDRSYSIDVSRTGRPAQGTVLVVTVDLETENISIRVQGGPS